MCIRDRLDVDVDVQTLPDLDVIILRGRNQDVQKLREIIEDLERLSRETQPRVHVIQLQHANSDAVTEILEDPGCRIDDNIVVAHCCPFPLVWPVAGNRSSVHTSPLAMIVVDREMLDAAVIPYRNGLFFPLETALEIRVFDMLEKKV